MNLKEQNLKEQNKPYHYKRTHLNENNICVAIYAPPN